MKTTWFVAGLIARFCMLLYVGVYDMRAYLEWGRKSLEASVVQAYIGIYFPFQYQVFQACAWVAARFRLPEVVVFKFSNLVFDLGVFVLLAVLLKRQRSNPAYALLYWLHPWFLSVFSLGYIDFHFTFFVLLCVLLLRNGEARDCLLAGILWDLRS